MFASRVICCLVAAQLLRACALQQDAVAAPASGVVATVPARYKTVLIAGDGRLPVFDNAVNGVSAFLQKNGSSATADVQRLTSSQTVAAQGGVQYTTLAMILRAVAGMRPAAGQGCFVFATSHGGEGRGLWLELTHEFLTPEALDRALVQGCGNAPTVVVISGCYTGTFTQSPMNRPNRVVLTAARMDRTSFGCGAGRDYTAFDKCLLVALDTTVTWPWAYVSIQRCVFAEERRENAIPSEPQAWFGALVPNLPIRVVASRS